MATVLLDTNVLSELVRQSPDPAVQAFVRSQSDPLISVLTIDELAFGAERSADPIRRSKLLSWIAGIRLQFGARIVDVDSDIAERAGRLRASSATRGIPSDPIDALIAACAISRGAAVATRNVRDFSALGVDIIDPWAG